MKIREAMLDGTRDVVIRKVGLLKSQVRLTYDDDYQDMWVINLRLSPQPCGGCKGTGKLFGFVACGGCEGKGHSPGKSATVLRVYKEIGRSFRAGLKASEKVGPEVFEEPKSFVLCSECLSPDCDGSCG